MVIESDADELKARWKKILDESCKKTPKVIYAAVNAFDVHFKQVTKTVGLFASNNKTLIGIF